MLRRITIASEGDEDDAVALLSEFDDELRLYALTESSEVLPVGMRIEEPFDLEKFLSQEALDASGYVPISDEEVAELSKMTPEERGRWLAQNAARKKREARTNELRRRLDEIEKKRSTLGRGGRL